MKRKIVELDNHSMMGLLYAETRSYVCLLLKIQELTCDFL